MEDILGDEEWPGKIRFVSTGSEANETALFMARLFKNRPNVITREYGFHGWTRGTSSLTRVKGVRSGLTETVEESTPRHISSRDDATIAVAPSPDCMRCSLGHTYGKCHDKETGEFACGYVYKKND